MHWICGWVGRRGCESDLIPYCCSLNKCVSSFQQFWSPSITAHFSITRIKANKFKSHLLTSQSLQHDRYWCSVKLRLYLWASCWNKSGSSKIKAKCIAKVIVTLCDTEVTAFVFILCITTHYCIVFYHFNNS